MTEYNDNLNMLAGNVSEQLKKNHDESVDKTTSKQMSIHVGYYNLIKKYCVMHDMKIVDLNDLIYDSLLKSGFFDDVKNL